MRVLAVTPAYPPCSRVGAWLATHEFLAYLVTRGHEVTVTTRFEQPAGMFEGVRIVPRSQVPGRLANLARQCDVVITHVPQGASAALEAGVPCVQMVHGSDVSVFDGAALVVTNSHALAATLAAPHVIVCHPYTRASLHQVDATGDALTLAHWSKAKGSRVVWRCAELLPAEQFLALRGGYGSVDDEPRVPNIDLRPPQDDMRAVWSQTRILLMPSQAETWGLVGVEAMSNGIPVIAHPTGGLRESLGHAGIFVSRDDPEGWVAEIKRLADPIEYENARARARARFAELDDSRAAFAEAVEATA